MSLTCSGENTWATRPIARWTRTFVPSDTAMPELQSLARRHHVEISLLGLAGGDTIEFEGQFRLPLADIRQAWEGAFV